MKKARKYSYIRFPYSRGGWYSLCLGVISMIMTGAVLLLAVRLEGTVGLFAAAVGFSGGILSLMGLLFAILGLLEKEHNHLFAWIGGGMSLLTLAAWTGVMLL